MNPFIAYEYTLSNTDYACFDILNENSNRQEILARGYIRKVHTAQWGIFVTALQEFYQKEGVSSIIKKTVGGIHAFTQ